MSLSVGDIIFVVRSGHHFKGKSGTVKTISRKETEGIGVEFEETINGCHNLNGTLTANKGFYFHVKDLVKMKPAGVAMKEYYSRETVKPASPLEPVFILEAK